MVNAVSAPALAAMIRASRDQALEDGARPLPPGLRRALRGHFSEELLAEVRWTTSKARPGVDTLLAGFLDYDGAVTLDHVIVFFNDEAASDFRLWLHELQHVKQYREEGVEGFARAYVSGWRELERTTELRSAAAFAALRGPAPKATPELQRPASS